MLARGRSIADDGQRGSGVHPKDKHEGAERMNSRSVNEISRTGTPAGSLVIHLIPPWFKGKDIYAVYEKLPHGNRPL